MRLLFERGKFDADATQRVALALACLAPGLLMFSMNNILGRAFYALGDISTPMKVSLFCLALNLVLAVWLVQRNREAGLGIANTLSAGCNTVLLLYALRKKLSVLGLADLRRSLLVLAPDAIVSGCVAAALLWFWEKHLGHSTLGLKLGAVFVPGTIAGLVYWAIALAAKVPAAKDIARVLLRRRATVNQ